MTGRIPHRGCYDALADEQLQCIVMEYVDGGAREKYCRGV